MRKKLKGYASAPGISMGKIYLYNPNKEEIKIEKIEISDFKYETDRFLNALNKSILEIEALNSKAELEIGKDEAKIFKAHKLIAEDPELKMRVIKDIKDASLNAEWVVKTIKEEYIDIFESIDDEVLKGRVIDIEDVLNRIIRNLLNINNELKFLDELEGDIILVAEDITPSDAMYLNNSRILGVIVEKGSIASHASIIAKTIGIPAITAIEDVKNNMSSGDYAVINGCSGEVIINPNDSDLIDYENRKKELLEEGYIYEEYINKPTISKDRYKAKIMGNIATIDDAKRVVENGGEGIGLVRTEFIYMDRVEAPSVDEQVAIYEMICKNFKSEAVVIRTLDIGGDKVIPYLPMDEEKNPFLGYRGIRYCLGTKYLFKDQIKAIYITSNKYNVEIMYPMVTTIKELECILEIENEVKMELYKEKIPYKDIKRGIMIETPAAAILSYEFAKKVDFFSIGTNDLIQYTMAVDRENINTKDLYSYYHPAVLRLIEYTIENAKKAGIKVGMCGEMASIPDIIPILLAMGLDEFSVDPNSILKTRYIINNLNKVDMEKELKNVLEKSGACEVKKYLKKLYEEKIKI